MQAKYFPKLSCYHTKRSEIKKWVENKIIYPAMKEHEKRLEKSILVALESYDGTKTVRMPDINREQSEFLKDVEIQKIFPCVKNVEWEELKEKLEDSYQLCLTVLIKRSNEIWEKQCQEVVEQFVKKKGDELFHNFWKEYLSFVKEWESCMKSGLDARISGNELFQIPPECEYGYFYQYYYYPTHTTELTVWLVYDYEMKQQIPGMLLGQMKYVAPDGTALDVVFEKRSRELLDVLLNQMKKKKMQVLQKWDDAVNRIYEDVCKNYEQIFLQLEQTVETSILPLWEGYKQNTEGNSNRRIQTILDFIKKGNMLPKIYVRLLEGYVSQTDLGMAGYCIYSDGKNVYDKMTAWVKNRAETAQKKWS